MRRVAPVACLALFLAAGAWSGTVPTNPPAAPAIQADPLPPPNRDLQRALAAAVRKLSLQRAAAEERLCISLVDVSDAQHARYAGINDQNMLYAASLPKIAVLLAAFEKVKDGLLSYTDDVKQVLTRMIRFSSNTDASAAIQMVSFPYIANVLTTPKYHFYDSQHGGLWVGKAYGGPNDYWQKDPLKNLSHAATSRQVARFFYLLDRGQLVDASYSAEMKEILSNPGVHHKFVKGLEENRPGARIYRKSGTWRNWHSDAALVERGDKRYIAVALMEDRKGGEALERLIVALDDLICSR